MSKFFKQNISRSPYQSIAAILVVSLTFFIITVFFLLGSGLQKVLNFFETRPQVIAYLKDETKPQDLELLKAKIEGTGEIEKINYVSKDEALKIYRELFKDKPVLLEMVTAKYLPASLEISTNKIASLKTIAETLKKESIVEDVDFQEDIMATLSKWLFSLRRFGLILAGLLLFTSVVTILLVLGMKISQRKEEIEILKLLGASSKYICFPLYLEGMLYGLLAALVSCGLGYLGMWYSSEHLTQYFAGINLFPVPAIFIFEVFGGLTLLGIFVGFLGSLLAVSHFMRASR